MKTAVLLLSHSASQMAAKYEFLPGPRFYDMGGLLGTVELSPNLQLRRDVIYTRVNPELTTTAMQESAPFASISTEYRGAILSRSGS